MRNHIVTIGLVKGQLGLSRPSLSVARGDTITWVLAKRKIAPFAVIIPSFTPPLYWACKAKKGNTIRGTVRRNAIAGIYPYAVALWDGEKLFVCDPDIIVPPPKGRH
jgi:hypothetical protein